MPRRRAGPDPLSGSFIDVTRDLPAGQQSPAAIQALLWTAAIMSTALPSQQVLNAELAKEVGQPVVKIEVLPKSHRSC